MGRLVLFAAGTLATAAIAQDGSEVAGNRTPANAQKFIAATPPSFSSKGKNTFLVNGVSSPDACKTTLSGPASVTKWSGNTYYYERMDPPEPIEATIDWSKVADIITTSDANNSLFWITVLIQNDPQSKGYNMGYTISASRDRVLAAAQYLTQACDETKELGF